QRLAATVFPEGNRSRCGSINARGRPWDSKPLPIDYEQCCSDQLNPHGNTNARCEPSLDHLLDGPVKRWQRLPLIPLMLRPIPLILRAERKRVCPRSIPVIAVPACLVLPGLFGRSECNGRPPNSTLALAHLNQVAVAHIEDQPGTHPFRRINLPAGAGSRIYPASDQLATHERINENYKGHERRVPRVLHGHRTGID